VLPADRLDAGDVVLDLRCRPVELDDQDGAAAVRIVRPDSGLGRLDRHRIHHLDRRGQDPGRDHTRDGAARLVGVPEAGKERHDDLRCAEDPQRQLRRDPERPLRADEGAEQVGTGVPDRQLDELSVRQDDLGGEDVIDGEAVLEAVGAARVLGDVAADRADLLRRGVGRVVEARVRDGSRHVEVRDPRLDDDLGALDVDLEDPGQPRERDDDPLRNRERAARQTRAGAAGDERYSPLVADPDDRLHLFDAARKRHERGHDAGAGETVALVRPQLFRLRDRVGDGGEPVEHVRPHWLKSLFPY
jgi:hypothetical protein